MSVLLVAGSPLQRSRSAALLAALGQRLSRRGLYVESLRIRDLSPQALLLGDAAQPTLAGAIEQVSRARALVVSTPVCRSAYSGSLKLLLDLLPPEALRHKLVLPLATGGSLQHLHALDLALRPVLQSLAPHLVLPGVYATDAHVTLTTEGAYQVHEEVARRLDDGADWLAQALAATPTTLSLGPGATLPLPRAPTAPRCNANA